VTPKIEKPIFTRIRIGFLFAREIKFLFHFAGSSPAHPPAGGGNPVVNHFKHFTNVDDKYFSWLVRIGGLPRDEILISFCGVIPACPHSLRSSVAGGRRRPPATL